MNILKMQENKPLSKKPVHPGKGRPLYNMFNGIPRRYDMMNRLLTMRFDEAWRKKASRFCLENQPGQVMDLCTGTGDLAVRLARDANHAVKITALDFSENMLELATLKSRKKGIESRIEFIHADASNMPFENETFDSIGIAFAFRNLTFKNPVSEKALAEIYRVLRQGGRFIITESSQPQSPFLRWIFKNYLKYIVDMAGGAISGHKTAYHYLAFSAKNFYNPDEVSEMLQKTGFAKTETIPLMGGIAAIHIATK